ncbi:MAG: glycoside hydrolase family 9 protein [Armatimonadaceae bacterium]
MQRKAKLFLGGAAFTLCAACMPNLSGADAGAPKDTVRASLSGGSSVNNPQQAEVKRSDAVKVCQVGYLPEETKFAMLTAAPTGDIVVRNVSDGKAALTVKAGEPKADADSGDTIQTVDFSALKTPGTYYLDVPGVGASYDFQIGSEIFARPFRLAMRSFTGQRCGTKVSLAPDFSEYQYEACHLDPAQFHSSSGKTGTTDSSGGWHDAGDYGKYIVNSGITTGTLLWAYELNPEKLRSLNLDLPESGGKIPDMLAEIKWNIDWMLKMQDADGGVWHKATTAGFPGFVMPKDDTGTVLVIGTESAPHKVTTATADFAAVCAIAARVYRPFDAAYADRCLAAAEKAWDWLEKTPDNNFTNNPKGISTGGYGDGNPADERLWAAAELFRTTGKDEYNRYFLNRYTKWNPTLQADRAQGWPEVANMAMYTYALSTQPKTDKAAVQKIKQDAVTAADGIVAKVRQNGYRQPLRSNEYYWGSNSVAANYAMMLWLANRFTPKPDYVHAAQDTLHYLLGRNTFNTSYVTQVGTKWAMNPHHRPSGADKREQPWPGLLVGGPNAEGKTPPARQWKDVEASYTTNENAINWNAALVFVLAEAFPKPK